jgi:gliding-associated putative ABC transporter substrate-binding component GldG
MKKSKNTIFIQLLIILAIAIVVNILAGKWYARLDLTDDNRYTLSDATLNILENLEEPVTISTYFTADLPPQLIQIRRDFKDMLVEYANYSDGMVNYEFIDPGKDEENEQEALRAGIQPVLLNVREKDQVKQQRVFIGAVLKMGERKEVLPVIAESASFEYDLSSAIKKISIEKKPVIGLIQGHGEPGFQELEQAVESLNVLYKIEPIDLGDAAVDLSKYKTLVLLAPTDSIPENQLSMLDDFMQNYGNLFIGMNRVIGDFRTVRGSALNTGLESWLSKKGIQIQPDFVVDASCGTVGLTQNRGGFRMTTQVQFPYLPLVRNFANHPATEGLEQVMFEFASSVSFTGDSTIQFTPLVMSSENAGRKPTPLMFEVQKDWNKADFPEKNITMAAAFEGALSGQRPEEKMVVVSDGDFAISGNNQRGQSEDNISLLVNSIDWLSDDTGLIELRTKGITSRPIDQLEDSTKSLLKYTNFLLPIILVILYGIIRQQRNKNIRVKRMEEGYV